MASKDLFFEIVNLKRLMEFTGFQMIMVKISFRMVGDQFIEVSLSN